MDDELVLPVSEMCGRARRLLQSELSEEGRELVIRTLNLAEDTAQLLGQELTFEKRRRMVLLGKIQEMAFKGDEVGRSGVHSHTEA